MRPLPALRRRRDDALIAAVLGGLAVLLAFGGTTWRADRVFYDTALAVWPRPPPPDIVIVAIDDASVQAIGRWPWPRTVHATLLVRLAEARPKAIAMDLVLSEPDVEGDPWLAAALQRAPPVVMPVAWQSLRGELTVLEPTTALRPHVALGAAESAVDADGVLRHLFLRAGPTRAPYPHLAAALLQAGGDRLHPGLTPERDPDPGTLADMAHGWSRDERLLLRFAGPPGTVPRVSYVDVLQGRVGADELAGRYLLVGMTAQGLGDTLATPVNAGHHAMPGVEVLANATALLRDGGGLRRLPPAAVGAGSTLALATLVFGFRRLGARRALPLALATVPLAAAASVGSVGAGWVWSPVPYIVPALLAYPLWSWRRLEHAVRVLDREIRALSIEGVIDRPGMQAGERAGESATRSAGAGEGRLPGRDERARADHDPLGMRLHELARAGQLLREARGFLAGALEGLPTAMLVGDVTGRVALANARAAALFEVDRASELQGLDLVRLVAEFAPATPIDWPQALASLQPGGPGLSVEARLGPSEQLVYVGTVELQGERRLIVSVADLAPVREAQRQREETLAFVSHDLRGPASAMVMLADLQQQGRSPLAADALLAEMRRLAQRTLSLADDFVHAARAQTRPLSLRPTTADELLADGMADARAQAAVAGIALVVRAAAGPPMLLDRPLVVRALANLVSNAVKHAPAGTTVEVSATRDRAGLRIDVLDAGPGMASDQRAALVRGEEQLRVGAPGGVGLGLLFARRVARRHGGSLTAAPGPAGRGERVTLRLVDQASDSP